MKEAEICERSQRATELTKKGKFASEVSGTTEFIKKGSRRKFKTFWMWACDIRNHTLLAIILIFFNFGIKYSTLSTIFELAMLYLAVVLPTPIPTKMSHHIEINQTILYFLSHEE